MRLARRDPDEGELRVPLVHRPDIAVQIRQAVHLTLPTVSLQAAVAPALRGPTPAALLAGVIRASVTAIAVLTHGRATGLDLRSPTGLGHQAELRKLIAVLVHFAHPLRIVLASPRPVF